MIQAIIHRLLLRRHFWRYATFGEVAELYASRLMRIFALRMVSVFTSVYLYQEGYSLVFIGLFFAGFFGLKTLFAWPAAKIAAYFGPKHGTLYSNVLSALAMAFLPLLPQYGLPPLIIWCVLQAFSGSLNDLCYLVDFSKVKHSVHAGKEIGYMNIIEKVATGLSPLLGGILAFLVGPESVMVVSAILFLLSAAPLLRTAEPIGTHQEINFRHFPWWTTWRSLRAETAIGFDIYTTGTAWTMFMAVVIFGSGGDGVYADIGAVTSVTLFAALAASYTYGKLIDRRRGLTLLRAGVTGNSLTHVLRAFVTTPVGVVFANIVNEMATTGYNMAFTRGMFDLADATGRRIAYILLIEATVNLGSAIASLLFALFVTVMPVAAGMQTFFFLTAVLTLLIATPRFVLYQR